MHPIPLTSCDCPRFPGTFYVSQSITIPYVVGNVGSGTDDIEVTISDDKGFALAPKSRTHKLSSHTYTNGTFTLRAGSIKAVTT